MKLNRLTRLFIGIRESFAEALGFAVICFVGFGVGCALFRVMEMIFQGWRR